MAKSGKRAEKRSHSHSGLGNEIEMSAGYLFEEDEETISQYSSQYEMYLEFFKLVASSTVAFNLHGVPSCWVPFLLYLGHRVEDTIVKWDCDNACLWPGFYAAFKDPRRAVEVASECRPELVDALYLSDTQWLCPRRVPCNEREFLVTGNGSLHRPEVLSYIHQNLHHFNTSKSKAILCPCAADKPYPSPLHSRLLDVLSATKDPSEWHLIIATGVLGLVPQELWAAMPLYDSGLPYQHRVTETVRWYFMKHQYERVVVYSDFYAKAISDGLKEIPDCRRPSSSFVLGDHYRIGYEPLMLAEYIQRLEFEVQNESIQRLEFEV